MQNTVNHYIQKWKIGRKHRREIGWVICILSVVVAGGVFWQLRMTGNTLNGEASCGKSEHTHSEKCLERRLICGLEEDTADVSGGENADGEDIPVQQRHVHTDACYENVYICGKEEHIHTLSCYADLNADVETASDWERTLPETLAGKKAEDLAAVAKSQIGYKESEKNFVIAEDGETVRNYTRYGQWYGNSHGEWNAMFAAFCLNYAGIGKDEIPYNSGCYAWTVQLEKEGLLRWPDEYVPYAGDLIFFDRDADGAADHVGIISDIKVQDTQTVLEVIEGNESVECREYTMQDSSIAAYVRISEEEEEQDVPKEDVSEEDVSKEENGLLTIPVTVYEDEIYTVLREGAEQITVSGYLPEGASAKAYPVEAMIAEQKVLWAYDIAVFDENGGQWEPFEQKLRVHVQMMEKDTAEATPEEDVPEENAGILVYYLPEEGEAESIPSQTDVDGVSFEAEHFSVYAAVAARGTGVEDEAALKKAFTDGSTEIQLTADFNVTGPIAVTTGEHTLDLNGHKLTVQGAASLFQVSGGSLKIIDSQAGNGTETFTYSVTETAVTDTATGATTETLKTYTVPIAGKIVGGSGSVVRVNGGSFKLESGALCNGTGGAVDMSGGTAELAGGYIFGFTKTGEINTGDQYFGGAILASGGELEISGTVLAGNKALNGGAVYAKNCKVTISGGVLSSNESVREFEGWDNHSENAPYRCGGGAVYCDGATELRMSGGYITNNKVIHNGYFDGGGGILISGTTEFTMDGGYITGNEASGGGGVRSDWNKSTSFIMEGGFISGNTAREAEGGGVAITQEEKAVSTVAILPTIRLRKPFTGAEAVCFVLMALISRFTTHWLQTIMPMVLEAVLQDVLRGVCTSV